MKKRLTLLSFFLISLLFLCSCGKNEPIVKFDEQSGFFLTFGFKPVEDGAQLISTAVNNSEYEIQDIKVVYHIKDSNHTIEESTASLPAKSNKDLSKVTQNYVHSLDEDRLYIATIDYTVSDGKKTQRIVYNPVDQSYHFQ